MELLSFYGDPNIGIYGRASNRIVLVGNVCEKDKMEKLFKVDCKVLTISDTDFIGLFTVFNSNGIVVPRIIKEKELEIVKKLFDNVLVFKGRYTAVGNLVLVNDKGGVISRLIGKKEKVELENTLGVELVYGRIANTDIVGSAGIATNRGCLLHRDVTEEEIQLVSSVLKVDVDIGTVNFGSPFVSSGIIANSFGIAIGDRSSGPEVDRIIRTLRIESK